MRMYLVRCNTNKDDSLYVLTNYVPLKQSAEEIIQSVLFWPPKNRKGPSFTKYLDRCYHDPWKDEVNQLGGEIPCGSVKDLSTGEIIAYENLPSWDQYQSEDLRE